MALITIRQFKGYGALTSTAVYHFNNAQENFSKGWHRLIRRSFTVHFQQTVFRNLTAFIAPLPFFILQGQLSKVTSVEQ